MRNEVDREFDDSMSKLENLKVCADLQAEMNKMKRFAGLQRTLRPPVVCWGNIEA